MMGLFTENATLDKMCIELAEIKFYIERGAATEDIPIPPFCVYESLHNGRRQLLAACPNEADAIAYRDFRRQQFIAQYS